MRADERERIAELLAAPTARPDPRVVQALVQSARSDGAPRVRAASLRGLLSLGVADAVLRDLVTRAGADPDPHVRQAVGELEGWLRMRSAPAGARVTSGPHLAPQGQRGLP